MKRLSITRYSLLVLFVWISSFVVAAPADSTKLSPTQAQSLEARLVSGLLGQYHYEKTPIDDALSKIVYEDFLKTLDANKHYFLQSDIDDFEKYKDRLDDHIKLGYLIPPYEMFNKFRTRFSERIDYVLNDMSFNFDYTKDEYITIDDSKIDWAENEAELNERWRKNIKSQALDLKLNEKADTTIERTIRNRYERLKETITDYEGRDVFQLYMNTFAESFDPHTNYFSPITSENFKIRMQQSLEGIGATLMTENDYTKVNSVVPGGPAFESKAIHRDDKIVAVAQGAEGEFVDVVGWRLDDVVQKIRGPKGTLVRLKIVPAGKPVATTIPTEIQIVRDKIKLDNQVPVSEVKEFSRGGTSYKVGIITIPSFYLNYEDMKKGEEYGSTTGDVKKILSQFKEESVDGVLVDLRYNGGGSLQEAIDLSGLFIEEGPVVQIRDADGSIQEGRDKDASISYTGPLAVLTNRFSASASEIFSGAMQDYKRGVIVGEQTFGKGTVQNLVSLNQFVPKVEDELGQVKLTLAKYYRINGSSTQHKGVVPDVEMPSPYKAEDFGESSYETALKWDEIPGTEYDVTDYLTDDIIAKLKKKHDARLNEADYLKSLKLDVEEAIASQEKTTLSLNLQQREKEVEEALERKNALNDLRGDIKGNEVNEKANTDDIIKDPYLREGAVVLTDLINLIVGES